MLARTAGQPRLPPCALAQAGRNSMAGVGTPSEYVHGHTRCSPAEAKQLKRHHIELFTLVLLTHLRRLRDMCRTFLCCTCMHRAQRIQCESLTSGAS